MGFLTKRVIEALAKKDLVGVTVRSPEKVMSRKWLGEKSERLRTFDREQAIKSKERQSPIGEQESVGNPAVGDYLLLNRLSFRKGQR